MLFSKVWMVLLAAAATVAFSLAFVAPRPVGREVVRARVADVHRAAQIVDLKMRRETRDWIDTSAQMARDRTVARLLQKATDNPEAVERISAELGNRVLELVKLIDASVRPDLVIATDARGKQIYRMGPGSEAYTPGKDGLEGLPLVEAALRGFRRDDTWNLDGKLFVVAGSPAIARTKARYVGAVILGEAVNDAFARRFKQQATPSDLAFFLDGQVVGASLSASLVEGLPKRFFADKRQAEVKKAGRTAAVPLETDAPNHHVVMAPLPGEAGTQGAFYAVVGKTAATYNLRRALSLSDGRDTSWAAFPWPLMVGGFLAVLVVGLVLTHWEVNVPLRRLREEAGRLASGSASRLNASPLGGRWRAVAEMINKAFDRSQASAGRSADGASRSPSRSPAPLVTPKSSAEPSSARASNTPAGEQSKPAAAAQAEASTPTPTSDRSGPGLTSNDETPVVMPSSDQVLANLRSRIPDFDDLTGADTVAEEPADLLLVNKAEEPAPEAAKVIPPVEDDRPLDEVVAAASAAHKTPPKEDPEDAPTTVDRRHSKPRASDAPREPLVPEPSAETVMSSVPQTMAQADERQQQDKDDDLAQYLREIYQEFMTVKRECGEDTGSLTLARFEKKLLRNRKKLQERFGCKSVRFSVYVKNGKAALKAIPVKD